MYQNTSKVVKQEQDEKKERNPSIGVYKRGNGYRAQYTISGITTYVGTYKDPVRAKKERDKALEEEKAKIQGKNYPK